jgi:hypothetical protein
MLAEAMTSIGTQMASEEVENEGSSSLVLACPAKAKEDDDGEHRQDGGTDASADADAATAAATTAATTAAAAAAADGRIVAAAHADAHARSQLCSLLSSTVGMKHPKHGAKVAALLCRYARCGGVPVAVAHFDPDLYARPPMMSATGGGGGGGMDNSGGGVLGTIGSLLGGGGGGVDGGGDDAALMENPLRIAVHKGQWRAHLLMHARPRVFTCVSFVLRVF